LPLKRRAHEREESTDDRQSRNNRDAERIPAGPVRHRPEKITVEARLFEDLDLDSIDAVDLIVKLQEYTGKKIAPTEFKTVRTVGDVVDKLHDQLAVRT
jgi:acyl carrier protein